MYLPEMKKWKYILILHYNDRIISKTMGMKLTG
jgi:hypothetical protein